MAFNLQTLSSLITGLFSCVLILYVLLKDRKPAVNKIFVLFMHVIAIMTIYDGLEKIVVDEKLALLFAKLKYLGLAFAGVLFLHFSLELTRTGITKGNRVRIILLYVPSIIFAVLMPTNLIISGVDYNGETYDTLYGPLKDGVMFMAYLMVICAVIVQVRRYFSVKNQIVKNQITYSFIGMLITAFSSLIAREVLPRLGYEGVFSTILLLPTLISFTYAIFTHKLFIIKPMLESTRIPTKPLERGYIYLVVDDDSEKSYEIFENHINSGIPGLCLTGADPGAIRKKYGLRRTPIVYISSEGAYKRRLTRTQASAKSGVPETHHAHPTQLVEVVESINDFLDKTPNGSVIILDCMEFIVSENLKNHDQRAILLEAANSFVKAIRKKESRLIVPRRSSAFSEPVKGEVIKSKNPFIWTDVWKNLLMERICNEAMRQSKSISTQTFKDIVTNLEREDGIFSHFNFKKDYVTIDYPGRFTANRFMRATRKFIEAVKKVTGVDKEKLVLEILDEYGFNKYEFLLLSGEYYIVPEKEPHLSFDMFQEFLENEYEGLCITRTHPNDLKPRRGWKDGVRIYWLTNTGKGDHVLKPSLEHVQRAVENFLSENRGKRCIVLLDGIEYLMTHPTDAFESVLHFVYIISDLVAENEAILLMPLDMRILSTQRLALLTRGVRILKTEETAG